jgi:transposase InsO family protein
MAHAQLPIAKGAQSEKLRWYQERSCTKTRSPTQATFSTQDVLHANLSFPTGMGGVCILSAMDARSRHAWAFPLHHICGAARYLKALILQKWTRGSRVRTPRTDRGGVFTSTAFAVWCGCNGIKHELSPSYVPKANGLVERIHGTVMPRLRAVIICALHAQRRLPRAAIPDP